MDCSLPGFSVHGIFQAKILDFPILELNRSLLCLLHCRQILYPLSHCYFNFQFPIDIQSWTCFYMLICHPCIIFSEMTIRVFGQIFKHFCFLIIELKKKMFLYVWDESFIRHTLCKYFLSVCDSSSHSLNIVFYKAEVLVLKKSSLSTFFFHRWASGFVSKKSSPYPGSSRYFFYIFLGFYSYIFYI